MAITPMQKGCLQNRCECNSGGEMLSISGFGDQIVCRELCHAESGEVKE